jgi:ComF family protein
MDAITGSLPPPSYPPSRAIERVLDLLFPPKCVACRRIGRWICARCWEGVPWLTGLTCSSCGRPSSDPLCFACRRTGPMDSVISVARFEAAAREAVHALKYNEKHAIAPMMGALMAEAGVGAGASLIAPVPLHRSRRRERGYDQAEMLAHVIGRALDTPCNDQTLRRHRRTRQQVSLSGEARRENVRDAFESLERVDGASVLLVDDVVTTGATMEAAAIALRVAGAVSVVGLTFCDAR